MKKLHNRVSQKELKEKLLEEPFERKTISFYKYFSIPNTHLFRDQLYILLDNMQVFGRIYIAQEGINAQISVPEHYFNLIRDSLYAFHPSLTGLRLNVAVDDDGKSFWVLKVKVREKIVADGIDDPNFDPSNTGKYLKVKEFNQLSEDPDTIIVDMRNHYEYEVGHYKNAIPVPSDTFKEQLPMALEILKDKKDKNIVMYCTGGIRCEKASAFLKYHGYEKVYHVEGGIIEYTNQAKAQNLPNKFIGKNFVFDNRLGERITEDIIAECHQCGKPCDDHTNCAHDGCHLLFIQCEECKNTFENCCSQDCMDINRLDIEEQKKWRKGLDNGNMIFNKSRFGRLRPTKEDIKKGVYKVVQK